MSLVAVDDVVVAVGGTSILDGISLTVEPGETVGIIGPNGAGKTTLLRVIAGDQTPTRGRVVLCGDPVDTLPLPELARRRAFLASETPTDVLFTVRDVVGFSAGTPKATTAALHTADVADIVDRIFASLSTGERQRVGIARVVAQAADVMLLDEPTASLDLGRREQVMEALHRYAATGARAVVAAIHDVNLAAAHTDRLVVLDEGRVVAFGTPRDVLTADTLTAVYRQRVRVIDHPERDCPMVVTVVRSMP